MMTRPSSPPPRMPSPDLLPAPLPSFRRRPVSTKQHELPVVHLDNITPPNCLDETVKRGLWVDGDEFGSWNNTPLLAASRLDRDQSPPSTPRSFPLYRPPRRSLANAKRAHHRSLTFAVPFRSPPPPPPITSPPPPVPPIPTFALDNKVILTPQPSRHTPTSTISSTTNLPSPPSLLKQCRPQTKGGMTCCQFLSLRNSTQTAFDGYIQTMSSS